MRAALFAAILAVAFVGVWWRPSPTISAQGGTDPTATLAAYQTQVAQQHVTIAALQTQVAELQEEDTPTPTRTPRTRPTSTPKPESGYQVGDLIEVPTWEITVTRFERMPDLSTQFDSYTARGVFVIVYLVVVNVGDNPQGFPYDDLKLVTDRGRTYNIHDDAMFALLYELFGGLGTYDELQPDLEYETAVIFDIPEDATGLSLT